MPPQRRRELKVAVLGADSPLGRRVVDRLTAHDQVTVVDGEGEGAGEREPTVVVETALADHDQLDTASGEAMAREEREMIRLADRHHVDHVIVVSSALVYGAFPNNPIPLTEDLVLRPDPELVFACQLAAAEQTAERWRRAQPGRVVTVLRPAIMVAEGSTSPLAAALTAAFGQRLGETDPDTQFVHLDDVASAVELAVLNRLDGVYNVAPDGSVPGPRVRELSGRSWNVPVPEWAADTVTDLRWRFQKGPIPAGLRPYTRYPWLVANDKLRSVGWAPTVTNEQAYVESTAARWWTVVSPKRRQEFALVGAGAAGLLTFVGSLGIGRWLVSRRR